MNNDIHAVAHEHPDASSVDEDVQAGGDEIPDSPATFVPSPKLRAALFAVLQTSLNLRDWTR